MSWTGKNLHRWLLGYLRHAVARAVAAPSPPEIHLLVAVCDHHEPRWNNASLETARARVDFWRERYPRRAARYRDADGRAPQHSFFFPGEEYAPELFDGIDELARAGLGEVELHLHRDGDTESSLRSTIREYLELYAKHGHFARAVDGSPRYAFIHGNGALANGRRCGVDAELALLFETGCYADFTFPSCPDAAQPGMVNAIYWPIGNRRRRRGYEGGERARVGKAFGDRVLLITGPLAVAQSTGGWAPRLEYGALTAHDPGTSVRARTWGRQSIGIRGRPEWVFVKLHTHGAPEARSASRLGRGGEQLHDALRELASQGPYRLHYVTAREMYNVARAAMDGRSGNPHDFRNHVLRPPPIRRNTP